MTGGTTPVGSEDPAEQRAGIRRRMVQIVVGVLIQAAILFLASGQWTWIWAWVYLLTSAAILVVNARVLVSRHPDLVAERGRAAQDAKAWDKWLALVVSVVGPLGTMLVAGLDRRFGWSGPMPWGLHLTGWLLFVLGNGLWTWAMISNRFFSGLVRVQHERGHIVVSAGPYAWVRHPGYLGMAVFSTGTALLLGSWWALLPAGLTAVGLIVRTVLEDRTLQVELPGYREYAQQVRYRLLPGVW
jgi:protein-S-isoprenylcysteine O-methyltransferase Ste14